MNNNIQNPVTIIMLNHHQNHDDKSFSIIKIMTGHHQNHDEMSNFRALFIIKIVTFLYTIYYGELAARGCQPSNRQGSKRVSGLIGRRVMLINIAVAILSMVNLKSLGRLFKRQSNRINEKLKF